MALALPENEHFNRRDGANSRALLAALDELRLRTGKSLDDLEQLTMRQIYSLAEETYGADLPEFWRIWSDWNRPGQIQPMGDL